jgi:DNA invertase Pin-like site-specific DNA recombinase
VVVPEKPWRERVEAESRLQRELLASLSASARRRAEAFEEGVRELGSKSAVAREVGITVSAVRRSIREYGTATAPPDDSTTEDPHK